VESALPGIEGNVEVEKDGRKGVIDLFVTSLPVRLSTIHSFVNTLIDSDVNDATFNISQHNSEFSLFVERNYSKGGSVVRVIDPLSRIRERPYEVRFARQNRPPALFYIDQEALNQEVLDDCKGSTIQLSGNTFSVTPTSDCDANISLSLRVLDPDEEPVSFSASSRIGMPHKLSSHDLSSPFPCIPHTISASDGHASDWQRINLRIKPTQFHPQCIQQ